MKRAGECHVAVISQRGYDQAGTVPEVFVGVEETRIGLTGYTVLDVRFEVVTQLFVPVEVLDCENVLLNHHINNIPCMHIKCLLLFINIP